MNKKGFTLVELILVVVILGIISAITVPAIMKSLTESKRDSGEAIEKVLKENLELYNFDHKEDLWCDGGDTLEGLNNKCEENSEQTISIEDLYNMNPDIDMGECLLQDNDSLKITKINSGYTYTVKIICGKNLSDTDNNKIIDSSTSDYYYKTE